ncbi:unnamed protein product, partial [Lymnaea stagnalis]
MTATESGRPSPKIQEKLQEKPQDNASMISSQKQPPESSMGLPQVSLAPQPSRVSNTPVLTKLPKTYGAQVNLGSKIAGPKHWFGGFHEFKRTHLYRQLIAELFGTFILVSLGCSIVTPFKPQGSDAAIDMSSIILGWGFTVASLVWTIAHVSGCFLNPAVTIAMFVNRRVSLARTLAYIAVQVPGAILGSAFHLYLRGDKLNTTCQTLLNRELGMTVTKGLIVEFYLTFFLLFFVFATTDHNRQDHGGSHAMMVG